MEFPTMPQRHPPRTHRLCAAIALTLGGLLSVSAAQAGTAAVIPLSSLDGSNGFRLDGVAAGDHSGRAVSAAGDINGDGIDDIIIGADAAAPNGLIDAGSSYVVFGRTGSFDATLNLSTLDGSNGFRLDGVAAEDLSGGAVSVAGDINGDGVDDLIIGAHRADPNGVDRAGSSYLVFGRSTDNFGAIINLSSLDGKSGFRLDGIAEYDISGFAVSGAGDINGDGTDDLIIGAFHAGPNGVPNAGSSYVLFGRSTGSFDSVIRLSTLDGSNGFRLDGAATGGSSGYAVSAAGDINHDGIDDLVIGASNQGPTRSGVSHVVFGRTDSFEAAVLLSTLDGGNGFSLDGVEADAASGYDVSAAGDINGDGIDDLIIGAHRAGPAIAGSSFVIFGRSTGHFASAVDLSMLEGVNGFRLDGGAVFEGSGHSVSGVGDMNGDGVSDLIIGTPFSDASGRNAAGSSYVVFGRTTSTFDPAISLSTLDGSNGFRVDGVAAGDQSGFVVSAAGDINGDGIDDLVIGAPYADPNGLAGAGSSYVVFGTKRLFCDGFESSACP
jgi:hypothetical protein